MTDPDIADVAERVRYHLDKYDTMAGPVHHDIIHAFVDSELRASDLRALLAAVGAGVAAGPQATPDQDGEATMPRVGGQPFRCPCGGNVFTRRARIYTCNSCNAEYEGTPVVAVPTDHEDHRLAGFESSGPCPECDSPHRQGERCGPDGGPEEDRHDG